MAFFKDFFLYSSSTKAATLDTLPFGSVIQIQGTDATMCTNTACGGTTIEVLPYKLVKMQARDGSGAVLGVFISYYPITVIVIP